MKRFCVHLKLHVRIDYNCHLWLNSNAISIFQTNLSASLESSVVESDGFFPGLKFEFRILKLRLVRVSYPDTTCRISTTWALGLYSFGKIKKCPLLKPGKNAKAILNEL